MDDLLEQPGSLASTGLNNPLDQNAKSSDSEEDALDWSKIPTSSTTSRPFIPKRGEKDFAPIDNSNLQAHNLQRAREAMYTVLRSNKILSSKSLSYGIWMPSLSRVRITKSRGVHFTSMGHSAVRTASVDGLEKSVKRLELLPEEALYLIERGSLLCYKEDDSSSDRSEEELHILSVQQAFTEMIGKEDITLEKYQVYSYLKRLGYAVTRYRSPSTASYYPLPPPYIPPAKKPPSLFQKWIRSLTSLIFRLFTNTPSWKPINLRWHHSAASILSSLRFLRTGHAHPIITPPPQNTPYKIFFNIYKPNTPLRKTAPPIPDFQCVVVDANETRFPSLSEINHLFSLVPESGPIPPRRKIQNPANAPQPSSASPSSPHPSWLNRLFSLFLSIFRLSKSSQIPNTRQPHPYAILRSGKKNIIIAAVDNGNISFFRLGQGAFEEMPML